MAQLYSLPSIYLGTSKEGRNAYERVYEAYEDVSARFPSVNQFLKHLLVYALDHDKTLSVKPARSRKIV